MSRVSTDDELEILRAVLWRMVTDAGGELVLGEQTVDMDARNSVVLTIEAGLIRLIAIPDYVDIPEPEPIPEQPVAQGSGGSFPSTWQDPVIYKSFDSINSGNIMTDEQRRKWLDVIEERMAQYSPLSATLGKK